MRVMKTTTYLKSYVTLRSVVFVLLALLGGVLIAADYLLTKGALLP